MARNEHELAALRRGTAELIAVNPESVRFRRSTRVSDGAGGWLDGPETTLDPQVVAIHPFNRQRMERRSPAGEVVIPTHIVLGMQSLDVEDGDEFTWNNTDWLVVFADNTPDFKTVAEVIRGH